MARAGPVRGTCGEYRHVGPSAAAVRPRPVGLGPIGCVVARGPDRLRLHRAGLAHSPDQPDNGPAGRPRAGRFRRQHTGQAWPPDLAAAAEAAVRQVAAGERPAPQTEHRWPVVPVQGRSEDEAGSGVPASHWSLSWFPSADGNVSGVALLAVDMTPQQQAADALRRSEERYRSLVQAGAQVVWITKPDGEVTEDSPEWRWITGQTADEYLSKGWLDAIHSDDRERVEAAWQDCLHRARFSTVAIGCAAGLVPTGIRRPRGSHRAGRQDHRMDGCQHRRNGAARGRGNAGRLTEQLSAAALGPPGFSRRLPCWPRRSLSSRWCRSSPRSAGRLSVPSGRRSPSSTPSGCGCVLSTRPACQIPGRAAGRDAAVGAQRDDGGDPGAQATAAGKPGRPAQALRRGDRSH